MNLQEYIEASKKDPGVFWRLDTGDHGNLLDEAIEEITRLRCDAVECHQGRDVLASLREAMALLPCCGTAAIMAAATQEIQGLRDAISQTLEDNVHLADGDNCTLRIMMQAYYPVSAECIREGAQLINGQWHMPRWGCDTLQHVIDELGDKTKGE